MNPKDFIKSFCFHIIIALLLTNLLSTCHKQLINLLSTAKKNPEFNLSALKPERICVNENEWVKKRNLLWEMFNNMILLYCQQIGGQIWTLLEICEIVMAKKNWWTFNIWWWWVKCLLSASRKSCRRLLWMKYNMLTYAICICTQLHLL